MRQTRAQRFYVYFGVFMAILMGASLLFPLIQTQVPIDDIPTQPAPTPTVPAPPADVNQINFDLTYLHPSGLFTVAQPTGWEPQSPSNNGIQAQINMRNDSLLSVIEAYVDVPTTPVTTLQGLSEHFNEAMLESGWRSYSSWRETGRRLDEASNRLLIDFELEQARQTYLARHVSWTDGKWIYVIRVVTTPNMRDLLLYLVENLPPTMKANELFTDSPVSWTSFYNPTGNEIIRYPSVWAIADGRAGFPVSIEGLSGESLRIEVPVATTIADEAAARAYAEQIRPGVTVNTVKPVTRNGGSGFAVSYNSTDLEGVGYSGLLTLLNGDDGLLHAASIRITASGVDLNNIAEGDSVTQQDAANVAASFNLTTGLNLPIPTATPTATPTLVPPTLAPTEAVSTEEASVTEEASATDEASATEEAEATPAA